MFFREKPQSNYGIIQGSLLHKWVTKYAFVGKVFRHSLNFQMSIITVRSHTTWSISHEIIMSKLSGFLEGGLIFYDYFTISI